MTPTAHAALANIGDNFELDNSKLGSTQQQKICWHWHVARIISSQKIYGLYAWTLPVLVGNNRAHVGGVGCEFVITYQETGLLRLRTLLPAPLKKCRLWAQEGLFSGVFLSNLKIERPSGPLFENSGPPCPALQRAWVYTALLFPFFKMPGARRKLGAPDAQY